MDRNRSLISCSCLVPTSGTFSAHRLEILQTYYCERLGKAVCVNIPQIFFAFYKVRARDRIPAAVRVES